MAYNWQQVPGGLVRVSVGGPHVWGVNAAQEIYRYNGTAQWDRIPGAAVYISAASDGSVWCVNAADEIYSWHGSNWTKMPGALKTVSVANRNNVWGTNANQEIYHWDGSKWTQVDGRAVQISAGEDGTVCCVNAAGEIFRRNGPHGQWEKLPGAAVQVSCYDHNTIASVPTFFPCHLSSIISVVNAAQEIYVFNGTAQWTRAPGACKHISVGAPGHGRVWCVNAAGQIFKHGH